MKLKQKKAKKPNGNIHPKRLFKTPEDLMKAFEGYKAYVKESAKEWLKVQYVGKDGERVTDPQRPPMSFVGFEVYCFKHHGQVDQYFTNHEGYYNDFVVICSHIKKEIAENQIAGGMLGFYNPSITQRLNGLTEKTESQINATVAATITGMEVK